MGAWGPGPFDNDTAADFAHDVRACDRLPHPLPARTALLLDTLRQVLHGEVEVRPDQPSVYELDYRVERAVAAVAFVADTIQGRCHHTDNAFARGVADDQDATLLDPVEFEPVSEELLATTMAFLDWIEHRLVLDDAGRTFQTELDKLRADLVAPMEQG